MKYEYEFILPCMEMSFPQQPEGSGSVWPILNRVPGQLHFICVRESSACECWYRTDSVILCHHEVEHSKAVHACFIISWDDFILLTFVKHFDHSLSFDRILLLGGI